MEQEASERFAFVGEGEMPVAFDRVNWGAFSFAAIWSLMYGPRRWAWAIWGLLLAPILIDNVVLWWFYSPVALRTVQRSVDPVFVVTLIVVSAVYAYNVDRLVWQRESARISALGEAPLGSITIARYRKSRRFWTRLFLVVLAIVFALNVAVLLWMRPPIGDMTPGWAAAVALVLFAFDIKRRDRARHS